MKEIIGDDYPTYEDSVKMTLAEQDGMYLDENNTWRMKCGCTEANVLDGNHNECKKSYSYLTEQEHEITKQNMERLLKENLELRQRLACIEVACDLNNDSFMQQKTNQLSRDEQENMYKQIT
jgi:hypothetical protein